MVPSQGIFWVSLKNQPAHVGAFGFFSSSFFELKKQKIFKAENIKRLILENRGSRWFGASDAMCAWVFFACVAH